MEAELWQAFAQITGGVNAVLLGGVLLFSPRMNRTRARQQLGLAVIAYGYLLFSFTAVDNLWLPLSPAILLSDFVVVLVASALLLDYMSRSMGRGGVQLLYYAPAPVFLVIGLFSGRDFVLGPAIGWVVILQVSYTALTTALYLRWRGLQTSRVYHLAVLLGALWVLHVFQLSRMVFPDSGWLFDTVPLVGAALVLAFTVLVLTDSRTLRALSAVVPPAPDHAVDASDVDLYMRTEKPHLDARLTLKHLAAALDIPARQLSAAVQSTGDGNFYQFVNRYRVEEARQLLADPRERRTSVEAIGLMAGFRARSTFYEAFRRVEGKTPAQFRADLVEAGAAPD